MSIYEEQGACGDSGSSLDEIAATTYSETHPHQCVGCNDLFTDEELAEGDILRCNCGALNCFDCYDAGGCQAPQCDRNADREER
jgi:hypothetical protein